MQKLIKRIFDIIFSLSAIIVLAPLWILLAVIIALSSPGGVWFKQRRTGYNGREFNLLKFRSMYVNKDADTLQASENDPRITPIGRFLRRTSIDELPQLWNVLCGDMSIIGPRPHMVAHTEYYTPLIANYMRRHEMRPGLTGYAQVKGFRGATPTVDDMRRRVEADIYYVDHYSLALDVEIFFLTIWKMITLKL
jgi:putative colanic acid biosynthesis UDP-glucose lipid carrier transferase